MFKLKRSKSCLILQRAQSVCRYVFVESRANQKVKVIAAGTLDPHDNESILQQLSTRFASLNLRFRHAIVMLPRTDLDVMTLSLPPATDAELPALVENAVAQEMDETAGPRVTDFVVGKSSEDACEALSFSCPTTLVESLQAGMKTAGAKLSAVTFGGMGAAALLKQLSKMPASTAIVVTTSDADIDLTVADNGKSVLFRTIPRSMDDELLAQRVSEEIRRTLTLLHRTDDEQTRVYLIGEFEEQQPLAEILLNQLSLSVSVVNPLDQISVDGETIDQPSKYANLIGMACAWSEDDLELDLLHPRRPPKSPGPWRRVAFWGAVAAGVLITLGYLAWHDRADQIERIASQRAKLVQLTRRANKARGLQDVSDAIQIWREDDVTWLDKLDELSARLPDRDQMLIRNMNMSTNSNRRGVIDLAVQVSDPDVVSVLEASVRDENHSVTSRGVMATDEQGEFPWKFDSRIVFNPVEVPLRTESESGDQIEAAKSVATTTKLTTPRHKTASEEQNLK